MDLGLAATKFKMADLHHLQIWSCQTKVDQWKQYTMCPKRSYLFHIILHKTEQDFLAR